MAADFEEDRRTGSMVDTLATTGSAQPGQSRGGNESASHGHHEGSGDQREHGGRGESGEGRGDRGGRPGASPQNGTEPSDPPWLPTAPSLAVYARNESNHLVWSFNATLHDIEGFAIYSIPPDGVLEPVATIDAQQRQYIDANRSLETWYLVFPIYANASMGLASNPASSEYPYCTWLIIDTPPVLRPECLLPLPGPNMFEGPGLLQSRFGEG